MKECMGEGGFTMLELLIVMAIISILAVVAIPKYNNAVALANTAKIQTDLQTLNTAIIMYQTEKGTNPASTGDLGDYVMDIDNLHPPKGDAVMSSGEKLAITAQSYSVDKTAVQASCQGHLVADFGRH